MSYDDRYPLKDYLNSINISKENLMEDEDPAWEKNYPPFIINKCMSHHMDTVMFANEMNMYSGLDKKLQYDFFINIVRTRKRFSPWGKKEKVKDIELVKEFYGYSTEKAAQALRILSPTQLDVIRSKLNKGGKKR
ncbi:DNA polymerase clamp loader subunit [Cyanophage S-RIM12_W1_24_0910]|uniref:DNA polymerase clamp loader subunit n=2 Tax=Brizovirus TaxID=2733098 RepID=A0A1D7SY41_9CAUD|nr:clamp loader of DNA polymerase [Cyanophage S-RIM12 isolate RW_01_0310]AOO15845.1 DNA polymerase clamp loader subunit [Cyanophage S-RIM12 isolate RW_01_0310]AOO18208.1 DNA polymerase clamp loader subunit [Cyanophage S-RIM12_Sn_07_0910]AOO18422.1 DNA polymerase clamp loader subunit [Cyanophage S-RIM12_Sn_31_0910]AOO19065.1 DNA polymerase clamp loader subunit [Cyanophage S-RIM12_W1_24_0910]